MLIQDYPVKWAQIKKHIEIEKKVQKQTTIIFCKIILFC